MGFFVFVFLPFLTKRAEKTHGDEGVIFNLLKIWLSAKSQDSSVCVSTQWKIDFWQVA